MNGIKILDFTRVLAGPYCTQLLGDMGADVWKVESLQGDETRSWGPPFVANESAYFLSVNRNKKSICINLKSEEGLQIVHSLAEHVDVVVENFIPGKADELGIGYNRLSEINPRIIYCSISGFGPDGPFSRNAGYDVVISAMGGLMHITGEQDGSPCKVGVALTDICTGLHAHGAILASILQRQQTNLGQKIDCSLFETQLAILANAASNYLIGGVETKRWGTAHESIVPYQAFPCLEDEYLVVGAGNDASFQRLCEALDLPSLPHDPKFATNASRVANRKEVIDILSDRFRTQKASFWADRLAPCKIPAQPINSIGTAFSHPQTQARNMIKEIEHPTAGSVKLVNCPVKYSASDVSVREPPPVLGQHSDIILKKHLNLTQDEISNLEKIGAIRIAKDFIEHES